MSEKPEALRLVNVFAVEKELRRLHAENERLLEALQDIARQPEGDEDSAQAVAKAALRREET